VAAILPWLEIAIGLLLVAGLFVRFAGVATAALAALFIAAMGQAKARGLDISCGCFGGGGAGGGVTWWDIVRDVPIALCGLYLVARPHGPMQLDNRFLDVEVDDGGRGGQEPDQAATPARSG
jgi:uncharacterized membrane protein YphA (DoxX/SURF4 family)